MTQYMTFRDIIGKNELCLFQGITDLKFVVTTEPSIMQIQIGLRCGFSQFRFLFFSKKKTFSQTEHIFTVNKIETFKGKIQIKSNNQNIIVKHFVSEC